jgi:hypothetical protein
MVDIMPALCLLSLQNPTELFCKLATSGIGWMECMLQKLVSDMYPSPIEKCCIYLSAISLSLLINSKPESDVHAMLFWLPESYCTK